MRITKREHACLIVTEDGRSLVIDPGSLTGSLADVDGVVAVVVTHEHPDHWTSEHIADLRQRFPGAPIYGPDGVAAAVGSGVSAVAAGDEIAVEPFRLRFYGGEHALIHPSIPAVQNLGVVVDERFAFGGDALDDPGAVAVVAVPTGAPWLKLAEVIDFVAQVRPQQTVPVHDGFYTAAGQELANRLVGAAVSAAGGTHHPLAVGETLDL